ncbi:UDP-glucuronosyl/UDP-glucosyltransferase [Parasponia andersonii]|uniref:Glycosyltransferase n=1 Tax=Parasponia andersonii TaxID=3476 RepID=A0A2P5C572_PARAD|nr:UDP-glucuronosyl/UDP-glucosyltransferase [Parasponia andersonii]
MAASVSSKQNQQPHFVLVPFMAQGHMIPMIDMARLFAERGVFVSLVTTPHNASRFESIITRASDSGLPIRLVQIPFPSREVGLPVGYENLDSLPSRDLLRKFFKALNMLQKPLESYLEGERNPSPSCIVSDKSLFWTSETARRFNIPRIVFHGMCCFSLLATHNIMLHNVHQSVTSDTEPFLIPGVVPQRVEITRAQLPGAFVIQPDLDDFRDKMREAETTAFGVVVNSFEELEDGCPERYGMALNKKVWCIGPVSLSNNDDLDKMERGNRASINYRYCLEWLDSKEPNSVVYACLGSQCRLLPSQLVELGLGLEASGQPFIWVVKPGERFFEFEEWLSEEGFQERIRGKGILIMGWAPQVLILAHKAVGGFLTHCGWNSTIEGVCSGLPMITWPLFAEQFLNEKLVVEVLRVGVRVGVEVPVRWGDEEKIGVLVKRDGVKRAVEMLMDGRDEEAKSRRERARGLREMARRATDEGGSSYLNISSLIQDIANY